MFDWLEYDNRVKSEYEEQEKQIREFLKKYIAKNTQIRNLPLFNRPDKETLERIEAMEIPTQGRDPLIVGEELVNDVFEHAMLLQHPRFYSFVASAVSPYSLAGSILTDIYNIHAGGWELSPCAGLIEE